MVGRLCWARQREGSAPSLAPSVLLTSRASTTVAGGAASPSPALCASGGKRTNGRCAGQGVSLKLAALLGNRVNHWKEGALGKGDKSISEPIFIIS